MEQKLHGEMTPIPEICPHCKSKEIDPAGKCQVCGLKVTAEDKPRPESPRKVEGGTLGGSIEVDFSTAPQNSGLEMPEWRHELSRRLLEIKHRRGKIVEPAPAPPAKTLPFPQAEQSSRTRSIPMADAPLVTQAARRAATNAAISEDKPDKIVRLPERNAARQPRTVKKADAPLPLFQPARGKAGVKSAPADVGLKPIPKVMDPDPAELQKLLDTIVLRQAGPAVVSPPAQAAKKRSEEESGNMLILLSRTLSGFMDLLIVCLLTGGIILAADFFSGIEMIDNVSKAWYGALLLATYLLYSTFFLGTANQTIGMMIKDLRVVGENGARPRLKQILQLSAWFLLSFLAAGFGLLWSFFDRRHRCMHDRISKTHVVRV